MHQILNTYWYTLYRFILIPSMYLKKWKTQFLFENSA
jgi:hypothetical protein